VRNIVVNSIKIDQTSSEDAKCLEDVYLRKEGTVGIVGKIYPREFNNALGLNAGFAEWRNEMGKQGKEECWKCDKYLEKSYETT
jgi:hypothetical protein